MSKVHWSWKEFGFCSGCHEKPLVESELRGDTIRFIASQYSGVQSLQRIRRSRETNMVWARDGGDQRGGGVTGFWILWGGGANEMTDGLDLQYEDKKGTEWAFWPE